MAELGDVPVICTTCRELTFWTDKVCMECRIEQNRVAAQERERAIREMTCCKGKAAFTNNVARRVEQSPESTQGEAKPSKTEQPVLGTCSVMSEPHEKKEGDRGWQDCRNWCPVEETYTEPVLGVCDSSTRSYLHPKYPECVNWRLQLKSEQNQTDVLEDFQKKVEIGKETPKTEIDELLTQFGFDIDRPRKVENEQNLYIPESEIGPFLVGGGNWPPGKEDPENEQNLDPENPAYCVSCKKDCNPGSSFCIKSVSEGAPVESLFWADLRENLKDPEFREAYIAESENLSEGAFYTETEMDAIKQRWFYSGYKAGRIDGAAEGASIPPYTTPPPPGAYTEPVEVPNVVGYTEACYAGYCIEGCCSER